MHEVIEKIYETNSIDDKPQYHKTPDRNIIYSYKPWSKSWVGVVHMRGREKRQLDTKCNVRHQISVGLGYSFIAALC